MKNINVFRVSKNAKIGVDKVQRNPWFPTPIFKIKIGGKFGGNYGRIMELYLER